MKTMILSNKNYSFKIIKKNLGAKTVGKNINID